MLTFLLSWNPARAPWHGRTALIRTLRQGGGAEQRWGARNRSIAVGDTLVFIRLAKPPKGVFAVGHAVAPWWRGPHWDPAKAAAGRTSGYVQCRFSVLLDTDSEPLLDIDQLRSRCCSRFCWSIQGSGVMIPEPTAGKLLRLFDEHVADLPSASPEPTQHGETR